MLRIVFTKENAINRFQRDFFEKKIHQKLINLENSYLQKKFITQQVELFF